MDIVNVNIRAPSAVSAAPAKSPVADGAGADMPKPLAGNVLPVVGQNTGVNVSGDGDTPLDTKGVNELVKQANGSLQEHNSNLKFTVAEGTDIPVIRIEDKETGELIRQIPSEAMVAIARALEETQRGTVIQEEV